MSAQLTLLEIEDKTPNWVLDRQTREVGLKGIALSRQILNHKADTNKPIFPAKELSKKLFL
jgi:hypothetical protein